MLLEPEIERLARCRSCRIGHGGQSRRSRAALVAPGSPVPSARRPRDGARLETPQGQARAHIHPASEPRAALILGHGAGGGVTAPDLVAATGAARSEGLSVALVEQPYRVAGRRSPAPVQRLDEAWVAVIDHLRADALEGLALVVGGRSLGARVACRTSEATDAVAVLCLAFPLQPPRRSSGTEPPSRRPSSTLYVSRPWSFRAAAIRSEFHRPGDIARSSRSRATTACGRTPTP